MTGFIVGEFLGALPAMLFFAVGFNVVVLSMNLIVDDYLIRFGSFMTATAAALIVGKAVLVANPWFPVNRMSIYLLDCSCLDLNRQP